MPRSRHLLVVGAALALLAPAQAGAGHVPSSLTPGLHVPQAAPFGSFSPTLSASPTAASASPSVEVLANVNPRGDVNGNIWATPTTRTWVATATPSRAARAESGSTACGTPSGRGGLRRSRSRPARSRGPTPTRCASSPSARLPSPAISPRSASSAAGSPSMRADAWVRPLRRQPPLAPAAALDREHASGRGLARALATGRGRPRVRLHRDSASRAPRLARRGHPRQPRLPHLRRLRPRPARSRSASGGSGRISGSSRTPISSSTP